MTLYKFSVLGNGTVNIYKNGIIVGTYTTGATEEQIDFQLNDVYKYECSPVEDFIKACSTLTNICHTTPTYESVISTDAYENIVFEFSPMQSLTIDSIQASQLQDNSVKWIINGNGAGVYAISVDGGEIPQTYTYPSENSGYVYNLSVGPHTVCASTSVTNIVCTSISVTQQLVLETISASYANGVILWTVTAIGEGRYIISVDGVFSYGGYDYPLTNSGEIPNVPEGTHIVCVHNDTNSLNYKCTTVSTNPCTPTWACELPLNGYEIDGCGNRRLNSTCNPTCDYIIECNTTLS